MEHRKQWIWIGVLVVILLGVVFIFFHANNNPAGQSISPTRVALPAAVPVPNEGSQNVSADVAVPNQQAAAAPGSPASFRSFSISIAGNAYTPNTVVVNKGDTVNLELTATDGDYGFTQPDYGLNASIPKGKTQQIQFQALQTGEFTFYCGSCGGPAKGPVGHIIVN